MPQLLAGDGGFQVGVQTKARVHVRGSRGLMHELTAMLPLFLIHRSSIRY